MEGFRTARALVLDNDRNEAAPVIEALGGLGVGVLFHTGDKAEELKTKHRGIRLLIVDMVLENRGASSSDPDQCVSTLIGTLEALLEDDHHPVVIVCWTKHTEFKDAFEKAFKRTFPKFRFDSAILFSKEELKTKPEALLLKVKEALASTEPFSLLLDWEQQVHNAATDTTSQITRLLSERLSKGEDWGSLAYKTCAALVLAERGKRVAGEDGAIVASALLGALNPLLIDRLEVSEWENRPTVLECHKKLQDSVKNLADPKGAPLPKGISAALNSIFHCVPYDKAGEAPPGTIWVVPTEKDTADKHGFSALGIEWDKLKKESAPTGSAVPILVEVTPSCDFAQDKASMARLVAGFMVDLSGGKPNKAGFLWPLAPLWLEDIPGHAKGEYAIVLSAKYFVTTTRNAVAAWTPIYRLRQSALMNLSAFVGSHVSRSGFMLVDT